MEWFRYRFEARDRATGRHYDGIRPALALLLLITQTEAVFQEEVARRVLVVHYRQNCYGGQINFQPNFL